MNENHSDNNLDEWSISPGPPNFDEEEARRVEANLKNGFMPAKDSTGQATSSTCNNRFGSNTNITLTGNNSFQENNNNTRKFGNGFDCTAAGASGFPTWKANSQRRVEFGAGDAGINTNGFGFGFGNFSQPKSESKNFNGSIAWGSGFEGNNFADNRMPQDAAPFGGAQQYSPTVAAPNSSNQLATASTDVEPMDIQMNDDDPWVEKPWNLINKDLIEKKEVNKNYNAHNVQQRSSFSFSSGSSFQKNGFGFGFQPGSNNNSNEHQSNNGFSNFSNTRNGFRRNSNNSSRSWPKNSYHNNNNNNNNNNNKGNNNNYDKEMKSISAPHSGNPFAPITGFTLSSTVSCVSTSGVSSPLPATNPAEGVINNVGGTAIMEFLPIPKTKVPETNARGSSNISGWGSGGVNTQPADVTREDTRQKVTSAQEYWKGTIPAKTVEGTVKMYQREQFRRRARLGAPDANGPTLFSRFATPVPANQPDPPPKYETSFGSKNRSRHAGCDAQWKESTGFNSFPVRKQEPVNKYPDIAHSGVASSPSKQHLEANYVPQNKKRSIRKELQQHIQQQFAHERITVTAAKLGAMEYASPAVSDVKVAADAAIPTWGMGAPRVSAALRACAFCCITKTVEEFVANGCPNCEELISVKGNVENVFKHTTDKIGYLLDSHCPAAQNYRVFNQRAPGMYSVSEQLHRDVVDSLKAKNINFFPAPQ